MYRTRLKGTLSQFLSVVLSLYGICYTLTGLSFSLNGTMQSHRELLYFTKHRHPHRQIANETNVSYSISQITKLVKSTGLCFIYRKSASFAFLSWLCLGLLRAPFFFTLSPLPRRPPHPTLLARTVTLSLSPRLCYSACLISRSLIGWLPAPREIPFSLPPTHPTTHPPLGPGNMSGSDGELIGKGWSVSTSPGCDSKQRSILQLIQCAIRIPARIQAWNAAVGHLLAHRSSCWLSCSLVNAFRFNTSFVGI